MPTEKNQSDPQPVARSGESSSSRTSSSELDGIAGSSASWTSNTLTLGPLSPHVANTSPLERLTDPTASYVPLPGAVSHTSADPQPMQHQGPSLATGIVTGHGMPDFEALDWSELLGDVDWVNINDTERDHLCVDSFRLHLRSLLIYAVIQVDSIGWPFTSLSSVYSDSTCTSTHL